MSTIKYGHNIRVSGHALNWDKTACNCGARPEGWDKSLPVRDWHREHKLNVVKYLESKESE